MLNCLVGELFDSSIRCLKKGGRFLEIGKTVFTNRTPLGISLFQKDGGFYLISFENIFERGKEKVLNKLLNQGLCCEVD